mgnify:CR=1 FL=1
MPLRAINEAEFANLWAGQAFTLGKDIGSAELTRQLAEDALAKARQLLASADASERDSAAVAMLRAQARLRVVRGSGR